MCVALAPRCIRAPRGGMQDEQGRWNKFGGRLPWDQSAICCSNGTFGGTGRHKTGEDYVAAPNIDHTQVGARSAKRFRLPLHFFSLNCCRVGWQSAE